MKSHTKTRVRNLVGPNVRRFRNLKGWSQAGLAAKCQTAGWDITRDIVATIENQSRWVGDFELVLLAQILHVPILDLIPDQKNLAQFKDVLRKSED